MEYAIALLLAGGGICLALARSTWTIDYAIWLIALNRGIRRVVDFFFNGSFNPLSPISLTPLFVGVCLFGVGLMHFSSVQRDSRKLFFCLFGALVLGFSVGFIKMPVGAVFSLGEWLAGIGAFLFIVTLPASLSTRNRWMKTAGWAAGFVAAYGWWQYFTIPPWDAMWLKESGMLGYMGIPKPMQMTCFSTMNERGVVSAFMAFGILPIFLNKQWRNAISWPLALLCLSAMTITYVRSSFIVLILVTVLQPLLSRGRGTLQVLLAASVLVTAAQFGLSRLPGSEEFSARWSQKSLTGTSSSLTGRLGIYGSGIGTIISNPLGFGLGSSGMAARVNSKESINIGDAGYLQILGQFGWIGAGLFFYALWGLWRECSRRFSFEKVEPSLLADPFLPAARALLVGMLIFLFVTDVFAGFSLAWVIFGCALNPISDPAVRLAIISFLNNGNSHDKRTGRSSVTQPVPPIANA